MKTRFIILMVLISSLLLKCGIEVSGTVHHIIEVDGTKLEKYFKAKCKEALPGASLSELEDCTSLGVAEFMEKVVDGL